MQGLASVEFQGEGIAVRNDILAVPVGIFLAALYCTPWFCVPSRAAVPSPRYRTCREQFSNICSFIRRAAYSFSSVSGCSMGHGAAKCGYHTEGTEYGQAGKGKRPSKRAFLSLSDIGVHKNRGFVICKRLDKLHERWIQTSAKYLTEVRRQGECRKTGTASFYTRSNEFHYYWYSRWWTVNKNAMRNRHSKNLWIYPCIQYRSKWESAAYRSWAAGHTVRSYFYGQNVGQRFSASTVSGNAQKLRPVDLLCVVSIDRFGRNYEEILEHWRVLTKEKHVNIPSWTCPCLPLAEQRATQYIHTPVLQVLSFWV